jgi:hypothetical protein
MAQRYPSFRRIVLGLQGASTRNLRPAVELAELLRLDLLGLFLEDASLRQVAGIPGAREFRMLGGGWHPMDIERLSRELDLAATSIERLFTQAVRGLATTCQFEVVSGTITEAITSVSRASDIMMIMEPVNPAEHATRQFHWLIEAAFRSAAAVMLVPTQIARQRGPIVAVAAAAHDPSIVTAAAIALAAKESLVVIDAHEGAGDEAQLRDILAGADLNVLRITTSKQLLSDPATLAAVLQPHHERLLVVTRGAVAAELPSMMAAARRVPVLVIEPPESIEVAPTSSQRANDMPQ